MRSPFDLGAKQMKDISLRILDMECAACVARLDRALEKLPELFDISRATIRTIRQNLTWALFYNLVSIPVAALGVLHPSICATAMSASSIGVLMHSLRLKDSDKKERRFPWKKKS